MRVQPDPLQARHFFQSAQRIRGKPTDDFEILEAGKPGQKGQVFACPKAFFPRDVQLINSGWVVPHAGRDAFEGFAQPRGISGRLGNRGARRGTCFRGDDLARTDAEPQKKADACGRNGRPAG